MANVEEGMRAVKHEAPESSDRVKACASVLVRKFRCVQFSCTQEQFDELHPCLSCMRTDTGPVHGRSPNVCKEVVPPGRLDVLVDNEFVHYDLLQFGGLLPVDLSKVSQPQAADASH